MWWNLALSSSFLSGTWCIPWSSVSQLLTLCVIVLTVNIWRLVLKSLLFYLLIALKCKRRDADNSDVSKRRQKKVFPISEKVKLLDLIRKEKENCIPSFLRSIVKVNHWYMKLWRRKNKLMLCLLLYLKLQKLWPQGMKMYYTFTVLWEIGITFTQLVLHYVNITVLFYY